MIQILKEKILSATKEKNEFHKQLYKTLLGEIQLEASRKNRDLIQEECQQIVKKFIKNNNETLEKLQYSSNGVVYNLNTENQLLQELLPETLSQNEILDLINSLELYDKICLAKSDGQAMGIAMQNLKGYSVEPSDVKGVVEGIRKLKNEA